MAVVLGYDDTISKIADILGVPKTARQWTLNVTFDDIVTIDVHMLAKLDTGQLEKLDPPHRYRLERIQ